MKTFNLISFEKVIYILLLVFIITLLNAINLTAQNPGDLDTSFGNEGIYLGDLSSVSLGNSLAIGADGKIVVAGRIGFSGTTANGLVLKLNSDGTLDTSFGDEGIVITDISGQQQFRHVRILDDGKLLVQGTSNNVVTFQDFLLAKYNSDGTLDTSFGDQGIIMPLLDDDQLPGSEVGSLEVLSDGSIIMGGSSNKDFGASSEILLMKYYNDGTPYENFGNSGIQKIGLADTDFPGLSFLKLLPEGKILLLGTKGFYNSELFIRLNSDGSFDGTFGVGGVASIGNVIPVDHSFSEMAIQEDQKILIVGATTSCCIDERELVMRRFNQDGTDDVSFGENGIVRVEVEIGMQTADYSLAIQSDNKILVSGTVLDDSSTRIAAVLRFNEDGSMDNTFGADGIKLYSEFGAAVRTIMFSEAKEIFITDSDALPLNSTRDIIVGKIVSGLETVSADGLFENDGNKIIVYPNPAISKLNMDFSNARLQSATRFKIFNLNGELMYQSTIEVNGDPTKTIDISTLSNGMYILHSEIGVQRFVKVE